MWRTLTVAEQKGSAGWLKEPVFASQWNVNATSATLEGGGRVLKGSF